MYLHTHTHTHNANCVISSKCVYKYIQNFEETQIQIQISTSLKANSQKYNTSYF